VASEGHRPRTGRDDPGAAVDGETFGETPSTRAGLTLLAEWGQELPLLVVAEDGEAVVQKSFRNIAGVVVVEPSELEVTGLVWARSLLLTQGALERVKAIAA
jgi:ribosomal protein L4